MTDREVKFLNADEVAELLDCSKSHAYMIIRTLNNELKEKGSITVRGRVSKKYLLERVYC